MAKHDPTAVVCDVPECEYSHTAYNKAEASLLTVLHAVVKHPAEYQRDTGNLADIAAAKYREYINAYRKVI